MCCTKTVRAVLFFLLLFCCGSFLHCAGGAAQPDASNSDEQKSGGEVASAVESSQDEMAKEAPAPDEPTPSNDASTPEPGVQEQVGFEPGIEPPTPDTITPEAPRKDSGGHCSNGKKDPGESEIDCGGRCPKCVNSMTQFGITWTFDRGYRVGRFANGDYWILGPIRLTKLTPTPKDGFHGFEINPKSRSKHSFDKRQGSYDAKVMPKVPSTGSPLTVPGGSSIVSTISNLPVKSKCKGRDNYWPAAIGGCTRSVLKSAAILTVLSKIPPANSFRPPYMGTDKTIKYNISDLKWDRLKKLEPIKGFTGPSGLERQFERPWIDHINEYSGAYLHPGDNMHNYGRDIASQIGAAVLALNLDFSKLPTKPTKNKLLVRFVQLGIDLVGMADNGQTWPHNGGHHLGRKLPILFAGVLLDDKRIRGVGAKANSCSNKRYSIFQEDSTTFYITAEDVKITASSRWSPDKRAKPKPYTTKDIGIPEWGIRHVCKPETNNFDWGATYRGVNAPAFAGFVLSAHIMGLRGLWAHPPLFDYQDRWMERAVINAKPSFFVDMWKKYRSQYGCWWARDDIKDIYSQGHYVCGSQKVACSWQKSSCSSCKLVKTCADYPDKRSRTYNPCQVKCSP